MRLTGLITTVFPDTSLTNICLSVSSLSQSLYFSLPSASSEGKLNAKLPWGMALSSSLSWAKRMIRFLSPPRCWPKSCGSPVSSSKTWLSSSSFSFPPPSPATLFLFILLLLFVPVPWDNSTAASLAAPFHLFISNQQASLQSSLLLGLS